MIKMASLQRLLLSCFLFTLVVMATHAEETETAPVKVDPESVREATGRTVRLTCTTTLNSTLQWQNPMNAVISSNSTNRVHVEEPAILVLQMLNLNDTGDYRCITKDGAHNATSALTVYIMPDYFFEGMVILIINACLIVIFFICLVHAFIKSRRHNSKQDKAEKKQAL